MVLRQTGDVIGQRPGEIAGFVDIYLQRRTPAHAAAVPQPGRKGRFPIVVQVGDYHPTGAALEDQQLLQGAVTPDAVKRSQIRRPGRGLLLPERGLRPQKPGEKGGQGPDRRPVGLFSQLRRLTCFPQAVRPVQNRCKCHCGGCRFRLHLLQKGQDHVLLRDRLSRARPVQQGPCRRLRCLLQHLYSHHLPGGLRDRPLPLGTPQQGDHCHQ